jgi:hypothetical protein
MNPDYYQEIMAAAQPCALDELHIPLRYFNRRIQEPKSKLISEKYLKLIKHLDEQGALDPNNADKTKINIAGIQQKWDKYGLCFAKILGMKLT